MGHDGVRDRAVSGRSRIGVQYLLAQSVRYAVSDSACVDEDSPVREGCEQTAPVSNAERRVQCDRLPNSVDVAFGDSVTSEYGSGQIGAFDLETSLACRALTESKIVHDGGSEEEVLVVVGVIQTALTVSQQAGEQKAADAVIDDRPAHRGARDREARIGKGPCREHEDDVHVSRTYGHRARANSGPMAAYRYDPAMVSKHPHRVAVLALPAVIPLELGIAAEIFGRDPHYRLTVCAEGRSASLPGFGLTVNTPAGLEGLKRADTLIIPGYEDVDVLTSAGVTTGIDLSLHLIRRDFGSAAANTRARGLVAPPQRRGGQAQFIERLMPDASGDQFGSLRDWMLENLALPLDLGTLATRAHVSRRTLSRRFREETGVSTMAWLADDRIDRAREILETTTEPVENIGRLT